MKWFTEEEEKMKRMKKSHYELAGTLDKPGLNATMVDVSLMQMKNVSKLTFFPPLWSSLTCSFFCPVCCHNDSTNFLTRLFTT